MRAATEEFAEKGFVGARVAEIAARAGVNKQLISYYFGGKEGLYRALADRWRSAEVAFNDAGASLDRLVAAYARASVEHHELTRFMVWEGITYGTGDEDPDEPGRTARMREAVADFRRRREAGELAADLDPDCMLLALLTAGAAPVLLPQMAASICGEPPDSAAFQSRYIEQLARLVRHLREAPPPATGGSG